VKRDTKIVAALLAAIPIVILSASLLCTYAIAHGASMNWRLLFRMMCHGMPARCLVVWSVPMPICARCTAIYSGLFAGVVLFLLVRVRIGVAKIFLLAASAAMAVDGFTQLAALRTSTNPLRVATGLAVGMAFGIWALAAMEKSSESADVREFTSS
jgi:uncharacterized membrane protein